MKTPLHWIDGPWPGRLAITPRPRGGDWLEEEVRAWQSDGIGIVVSFLTREEIAELDLTQEHELCEEKSIEYISFPVEDRGVPASPRQLADLVHDLETKLSQGKRIAIHCRQGIGRSAIVAACLLIASGMDGDQAFLRIAGARGCPVPDTMEQRQWTVRFAGQWLTVTTQE